MIIDLILIIGMIIDLILIIGMIVIWLGTVLLTKFLKKKGKLGKFDERKFRNKRL